MDTQNSKSLPAAGVTIGNKVEISPRKWDPGQFRQCRGCLFHSLHINPRFQRRGWVKLGETHGNPLKMGIQLKHQMVYAESYHVLLFPSSNVESVNLGLYIISLFITDGTVNYI
jgi:hypothetical protein